MCENGADEPPTLDELEEPEEQEAELVPKHQPLSVSEGPLRGPMPLDDPPRDQIQRT
jgi:hypothetical protein